MAECSSSTDSLTPAASDIENDDLSSTVLPCQYEPEGSEVDSEDSPDDENEMRLNNTNWCLCGNCCAMPTVEESICCREIEQIKLKNRRRSKYKYYMYYRTRRIPRRVS
uniref:Uncharacterized protein n=1 Tax=Amphimedon queenslandica TaxID=400682 RepID=A0A1X7UX12_AMPQE